MIRRIFKNTLAIILISSLLLGIFSFVWNTTAYADCPRTSRNSGIECSTYSDCPWNYPACSTVCTSISKSCAAGCCAVCAGVCLTGSTSACLGCVMIACPICIAFRCCTRWEKCCIRAGYSIEPTGIHPE